MVQKFCCDRCGKEIPEGEYESMRFQGWVYYSDRPQVKMDGDLCSSCARSFKEWLRPPQTEGQEEM